MQKITPFLWFDKNAEEAVNFYVDVFKNAPHANVGDSRIVSKARYDKVGAKVSGMPEGSIMTMGFEIGGMKFTALNGGPEFKFSMAVSFVIRCDDQEEVDYFWDKLSEGGESGVCGWINRDKFGVTWQVTPDILVELIQDRDPAKASRAMEAMIKMTKIDIAALQKAVMQTEDGEPGASKK